MKKLLIFLFLVIKGINVYGSNPVTSNAKQIARPILFFDVQHCQTNSLEWQHIQKCGAESHERYYSGIEDISKKYQEVAKYHEKMNVEIQKELKDLEKKTNIESERLCQNQRRAVTGEQFLWWGEKITLLHKQYAADASAVGNSNKYVNWQAALDIEYKAIAAERNELTVKYKNFCEKSNESLRQIEKKLKIIAADIAKSLDAAAVLPIMATDICDIYVNPLYNITEEALFRLNKEYLESNYKYNCDNPSCGVCSNQDDTCSRNVKNCYAA